VGFKFHGGKGKEGGGKRGKEMPTMQKKGNGENATKTTEYNKSALKAQLSELICMPFARSCTQKLKM